MNILSLLENQISSPAVGRISNALGESPEGVKSAMGGAFPALLGSLLGKVKESPNGAGEIFNMLKQGSGQGAWPEKIEDAASAVGSSAAQPAQHSLLTSLLGPKLGAVSEFLSARSGIRQGSAMSLLGMAAPMLMGTLGRQVTSGGLNSAGLGQLLMSQAGHLKDSLPPELGNMLGVKNLISEAPAAAARATQAVREPAMAKGGNVLKWAWVPLVIALAAWFAVSHSRQPAPVGGTSENGETTVAVGHAGHALDLSNLHLTPGSPADQLAKAISTGNWNEHVELSGMTPDSSGHLPESANTGLQEITALMAAAPDTKVRITGHGDNADAGMAQADAIKNALVSKGLDEGRIMASGEPGSGPPAISLVH